MGFDEIGLGIMIGMIILGIFIITFPISEESPIFREIFCEINNMQYDKDFSTDNTIKCFNDTDKLRVLSQNKKYQENYKIERSNRFLECSTSSGNDCIEPKW